MRTNGSAACIGACGCSLLCVRVARACACACAAGCAGLYRCETRCGTHSLSMGHSHSPDREGNLAAVLNPANWRNYRPHLCLWSSLFPPLFHRISLSLSIFLSLSLSLSPSAFAEPTFPPLSFLSPFFSFLHAFPSTASRSCFPALSSFFRLFPLRIPLSTPFFLFFWNLLPKRKVIFSPR